MSTIPSTILAALRHGLVIPAHPLALTEAGALDERRQRALTRYYDAAGAGGLAVGVHTTQFAIRDPRVGLFEPVLTLAAEEMDRADSRRITPLVRIGGICGETAQAVAEAELLARLGYHAGLLSLAALATATEDALIAHGTAVSDHLPIVGFYLQPSVGGRPLSYAFWRRFAEIPNVVAIKIAPFNRYQTLDVVRAVVDAGRDDIVLYTGNDDHIVGDLVTCFRFTTPRGPVERRIVGGLLGHWAVWTMRAVQLLERCQQAAKLPRRACGSALDWRRSDRLQRSVLRRGQWIRGMHCRIARSAAPSGPARAHALPGPAREIESRAARRHRSSLRSLSSLERRRVRRGAPRRMAQSLMDNDDCRLTIDDWPSMKRLLERFEPRQRHQAVIGLGHVDAVEREELRAIWCCREPVGDRNDTGAGCTGGLVPAISHHLVTLGRVADRVEHQHGRSGGAE